MTHDTTADHVGHSEGLARSGAGRPVRLPGNATLARGTHAVDQGALTGGEICDRITRSAAFREAAAKCAIAERFHDIDFTRWVRVVDRIRRLRRAP